MKKTRKSESFAISSNLFPCVSVSMYNSILSPDEQEENAHYNCGTFEYASINMEEYKSQIVSLASDFISEKVLPIMKTYGLDNIIVEEIHSPKEYNFQTDCLYFTVEMSSGWRKKMHSYLNKFRKISRFQEYIDDNWRSCDGFWSWMPESFDEIEEMNDEERCVGAYLTLCLLNEGKTDFPEESLEYIYYGMDGGFINYHSITEDYLGPEEGKNMDDFFEHAIHLNEIYHDLLNKIGNKWKGCDRIYGKSDKCQSVEAICDAMRLVFWACENGYTVSDLENMAV